MESCSNCTFYLSHVCCLTDYVISNPNMFVCDDWDPLIPVDPADFDDDINSPFIREECKKQK